MIPWRKKAILYKHHIFVLLVTDAAVVVFASGGDLCKKIQVGERGRRGRGGVLRACEGRESQCLKM